MSGREPVDPASLDDDELLALLGQVVAATDPPPPSVVAGALAAETWRTIDAELADLVFDSAMELAGTRGPTNAARELTFQAGDVEIEILVTAGVHAQLEGQLIPAVVEVIELASLASAETAAVDELGRFRFDQVPPGPVRLGVQRPEGWVHTTWVVLRAA